MMPRLLKRRKERCHVFANILTVLCKREVKNMRQRISKGKKLTSYFRY